MERSFMMRLKLRSPRKKHYNVLNKAKLSLGQKVKLGSASLLTMMGATSQLQAQHASHAVMTITTEVVAAPKLVSNIVTDITDQLQEATENLSFGDYSIKNTEDTGYIVRIDPVIKMNGITGSWDINTLVSKETDSKGMLTLNYTGKSPTSSVPSGQYTGQ